MKAEVFSVSLYLDLVNEIISSTSARIQGEVGQINKRGTALYFSIRDKGGQAVLNCFMWQSDYRMTGVEIEEGMEIIVTGYSEIYKPTGRLALHIQAIELVGEGELKKAYDKLRAKLDAEGFFDPSLKKELSAYPRKIGVITSREGAVIHDFLNNLDRRGFEITLIDSRVEGARCVPDIVKAIRYFKKKDIDALVVIRGGGSLESFIPFNNEVIIREMKMLSFPVIAGIGHDKDVPLFSLAADIMTSTPTAVTQILNSSWTTTDYTLKLYEQNILSGLRGIKERIISDLNYFSNKLTEYLSNSIRDTESFLRIAENILKHNDPHRQLKLGYSIARANGKVVKSVKDVKKNQRIVTEVSDGKFESDVL